MKKVCRKNKLIFAVLFVILIQIFNSMKIVQKDLNSFHAEPTDKYLKNYTKKLSRINLDEDVIKIQKTFLSHKKIKNSILLSLIFEKLLFSGCVYRKNIENKSIKNSEPTLQLETIDCFLFCLGRNFAFTVHALKRHECFCANKLSANEHCNVESKPGGMFAAYKMIAREMPTIKVPTCL